MVQKKNSSKQNNFQPTTDSDKAIQLEDRLRAIKIKEEEALAREKAKQANLAYLDLTIAPIDTQTVWLIPEKEARAAGLAALYSLKKQGGQSSIQLAVVDPENSRAEKIIADLQKKFSQVDIFVVSQRSLERAWARYLETPSAETQITGRIDIASDQIKIFREKINNINDASTLIKKTPPEKASDLLEVIIAGALETEASDLHLEMKEKDALLRYRLDGVLQDVVEFSPLSHHILVNRIKLLSEMKLNRKDIAQDGRFTIAFGETRIEVRVSVIPGAYGENVVMRVLNPKAISLGLEDLGFREDQLKLMQTEIKKPNGMIITTGPTGSGKTTALYAFIREVATSKIKVITLEDPVEYHLPRITQTQIEPEKGYTFADGLRAILRQDPDVILVGEIRDKETAEIAIHASLTGHLVFSTLHTNDAAGAVPRLVEMGVNPAILSAALNDVLAQRLVRRLCQKCKEEVTLAGENEKFVKEIVASLPDNFKKKYQKTTYRIFEARGCQECNNTGYKGRVGIFEVLNIDSEMEKLIAQGPSHAAIKEFSLQKGLTTMLQDGLMKVLEGITSLEEIGQAVSEK